MTTIMPRTMSVELERLGKTVEVRDLSVGYIDRCRQNPEMDTPVNTVLEATDLSREEVESLGRAELAELGDIILRLTFPDASAESETEDDGGKP